MTTIINTLNDARESTITDHYNAAFAELKAKVTAEPLRTKFNIYCGCPTNDVATEVAKRLTKTDANAAVDISAKVSSSGWFRSRLYLEVVVSLPKSLLPKEEVKEAIAQ
jgi:hypothetical protein